MRHIPLSRPQLTAARDFAGKQHLSLSAITLQRTTRAQPAELTLTRRAAAAETGANRHHSDPATESARQQRVTPRADMLKHWLIHELTNLPTKLPKLNPPVRGAAVGEGEGAGGAGSAVVGTVGRQGNVRAATGGQGRWRY